MNRFEYVQEIDDLGFTVIENAFINHYMPKARGDYVKVYLYGLKNSIGRNASPSNQEIALTLKLTEGDVLSAWKYWDSEGILNFIQEGEECIIEYRTIASKLLINGANARKKPKKSPTGTSSKIRQMNKDIEEKIGRPLTHSEIELFLSWIEEYHFTPQTIVLIISDCIDRDKRAVKYWESMAVVFHDSGVKTYDQAQQFIQSRELHWNNYREILNYLGQFRLPTKPEKELIDSWFDEYHFDMDAIKKACDETIGSNKPNLKYVHNILTSKEPPKADHAIKKLLKSRKMENDHNYDVEMIEEALFGGE